VTTTINGTLLQTQFQDSDITVTNAEIVVDAAIDLLNVFGADLDNLTGAAGSKTGSYTSAEAGAVMTLAREVYRTRFSNAQGINPTVSSVSASYSESDLLVYAEKLGLQLQKPTTRAAPPIYVYNSPIE
jgi:hypothetical protein